MATTLRTDHLLAEERRLLIVDWTRKDGRLDAGMAAKKLSVATETVRRDLDVLERRGARLRRSAQCVCECVGALLLLLERQDSVEHQQQQCHEQRSLEQDHR